MVNIAKNLESPQSEIDREFERVATMVSIVGIVGNVMLTVFKAVAGIIGHSSAMLSDAIHSASDVIASIIVIAGVKISRKEADEDHPYGHERYECVAALVLAIILLYTGLMIGIEAIRTIVGGSISGIRVPGRIALIAAGVSIVTKEAMYHYTVHYARRIRSESLRASAWDHRSDALSSIGALIGIAGARLGYPVLDPIASVVICFFIIRAAYSIFKGAIEQMVDKAVDEKTFAELKECIEKQDGVKGVDHLRTRVFGNKIYIDVDIAADGNLSLVEGHAIAERVHDAIEGDFASVKHIMVHVNPLEEER